MTRYLMRNPHVRTVVSSFVLRELKFYDRAADLRPVAKEKAGKDPAFAKSVFWSD